MLDFALMMGAALPLIHETTILRLIHALTTGHAALALTLVSSTVQIAWLQLGGRAVPSSRRWAVVLLLGVGLCGSVFAGFPPGSRLVVTLLSRAARTAARSKLWAQHCSLKTGALPPTSRPAPGVQET